MTLHIPEIENCCDKETYAFFGLAAYFAQVLEQSAINLAFAAGLPDVHLVSRELWIEIYESLEKKTFGKLIYACREAVEIPNETDTILFEALELRNMLIHSFFRERAEKFMSELGRIEMKKELQVIIEKFRVADGLLERIYLPILSRYGVTDSFLEREFKLMQERLNTR